MMASHAKGASILPASLPSGEFTDLCPDCSTRIVASTPDDVDGASCACPPQRYEYLVELVCSLCSRAICKVRVHTPHARIIFLRSPRCATCGGQAITSGDVQRVAIPVDINWQEDTPRRGLPA